MRNRKNFMAVALWILSAAAVAADRPLRDAPEISLKDASGKIVRLADYKGRLWLPNSDPERQIETLLQAET